MSITLKEDKSLRLEAFSLHDFVFEVAKAAKSGYSPVDTNDKYVQGFSSWFTCGMVPFPHREVGGHNEGQKENPHD